jgi:RNA polymerase sigma-70 factor (ECF subfamily)
MHENQARLLAALTAPAPEDEVGPVLDEELSRLPETCRAALVLCYFQGMTNEEAARRLRQPPHSVKGQLARGRRLLRARLARRGVYTSAAMLAALLVSARSRAGSVPAPLSAAAVGAGLSFVGRGGHPPPSPQAVKLANSALRSVPWRVLAVLALVLALAGGVFVGRWLDRLEAGESLPTDSSCHPYDADESPGTPAGR